MKHLTAADIILLTYLVSIPAFIFAGIFIGNATIAIALPLTMVVIGMSYSMIVHN